MKGLNGQDGYSEVGMKYEKDPEECVHLADIGRFKDALQCLDLKIKDNPLDTFAHIRKAIILEGLGELTKALESWDTAFGIDEENLIAYVGKGEALKIMSRHEDAISHLDNIFDMESVWSGSEETNTAWAVYKAAYLFHGMGKPQRAIRCLNRVIELEPDHYNAHFMMGHMFGEYYDMTGKDEMLDKAMSSYDLAVKANPKSGDALYNKGLLLGEAHKPEEALKCFDEASRINPKNPDAHMSKGSMLMELGKCEDAILCYDKALKLDSKSAKTMYNKAKALWILDYVEGAKHFLNKARRIDPELPDYDDIDKMLTERLEFNKSIHKTRRDSDDKHA